MQLRVGRR